jgi:hypothetical protein
MTHIDGQKSDDLVAAPNRKSAIGIFDSGVGGLTVFVQFSDAFQLKAWFILAIPRESRTGCDRQQPLNDTVSSVLRLFSHGA